MGSRLWLLATVRQCVRVEGGEEGAQQQLAMAHGPHTHTLSISFCCQIALCQPAHDPNPIRPAPALPAARDDPHPRSHSHPFTSSIIQLLIKILGTFAKLEVVNSPPSRSAAGTGAGVQQQQQSNVVATYENAKFHLPELKVSNNNNHNGCGGQPEQQQSSSNEALSAYDRQQQQIEVAIAAAINGGSVDSPDRNGSSASSHAFSVNNDEFVRRLIEVVKQEPCLYNSNHEHYGNKHMSAQFRATIWQRLCKELDYPEDSHSLQMQWKKIRDRYVRERRRRRWAHGAELEANTAASRTFHLMRWIDEYLGETHSPATGGNVLMHLPGTSGSDPYYDQQQQNNNHVNGAGMNLVGKEPRVGGGQRFTKRLLMQGGDVKPVVAGVGGAKKNNESTNGSPSSTSSEISVGSAQFGNGGTVQQQQQLHSQQGSQIMLPKLRHIPLSQGNDFGTRTHQLMYKMKQESAHEHLQQVAVAESAAGQHMGNYQIISIPPSQALHGPPAEESNNSNNYFSAATTSAVPTSAEAVGTHSPRRKRMALDTHQMQQPTGNGGAHQQRSGGGGGGSSRHLVIEPERIVLNQQQQMLPGAMLMHPPQQQQQQQVGTTPSTQIARSGSGLRLAAIGGARGSESAQQQIQSTSTAPPITAPQYILSTAQPQAVHYVDPEAGFVELIVRHLRNLNDDEKIVTKMNIQRILMDARFGRGACVRMFNDELAMEQQRQHVQQQQQQNSVNMRR